MRSFGLWLRLNNWRSLTKNCPDPVVTEVQHMRDIAFTMGEVRTEGFGVEAQHWFTTMTAKIDLNNEQA